MLYVGYVSIICYVYIMKNKVSYWKSQNWKFIGRITKFTQM